MSSSSPKSGSKRTAKRRAVRKTGASRGPGATRKSQAAGPKSPDRSSPRTKEPRGPKSARPSKKLPEVEVDPATLEFIEAIERFKRDHQKPFPTWSEVLWVVRSLGYRKPE
jgi:hypothetical protein